MQYKSIAAAFALFAAAAAMAIPAAAPAGVGALEARNWNWKQQYPDVKNWVAYKKPDGTWCEPYTEQYSYSYAYSVSSFVSYSYNTNHPKARNWDWKQQYPDVKSWLAYPKDNGNWCQPEDDDFSYSHAYSYSYYASYSSSSNQ